MGGDFFQGEGMGRGLALISPLCEGGGVEINFCLMRGGYDLVSGHISHIPPPLPGNCCTVPNMEKALFDWPIVLQYGVKAKYRLISRKFSGVCIPLINQSYRSISVPLLFLFCWRIFISRSYENRSITHVSI